MSQFSMMIPIQGGDSLFKPSSDKLMDGPQADLKGDGEDLSFAQSLLQLSEANPNGAALLLALQQTGVLPDLPLSLQAGGRLLPSVTESGGKALPLPQLQPVQLNGLPSMPVEELASFDPRQPQQLLAQRPMPDGAQVIVATVAKGSRVAEARPLLESRGLGDLTAQLQGLNLNAQHPQSVAAPRSMAALPVQLPVGQPGWDSAVGERIQWMVSRNVQQAEIKLTPPELGPMEIKLSLQNDQTSVHFLAHHSATRDALEAAIPRLRELFGEINLNLANVDVGQRQDGGRTAHEGATGDGAQAGGRFAEEGYDVTQDGRAAVLRLQSRGLLDTYA
ncbi:MAG: flagellar hook-length control protein FliK [Alphaproteobacteria bacterium]